LNAGADDFLSEPIENEEFIARVNAHLRRRLEDFSSRITRLPMADITIKVLHHKLSSDEKWAVLMIDIDHFNEYQQIYGDIAANKMLQTYAAIIKASISKDDYLGQLDKNNFVVITNVLKAEKLSSFVKYAFDTVANKFYSEKDVKLGYITLEGDDVIGQRIRL
jgi:diguanylate cyclase (GGDEF)-like protein